jgi:predicted ATPase
VAVLKRFIIERTEGNPFFMEETVQALVDEGTLVRNGTLRLTKPLGELKIPLTVQAMLAARIDRLPPAEKELLQTLAVIGKELALELIKGVTGQREGQLQPLLTTLQLGEFIYEQPRLAGPECTCKHALTQEVAYNSVLTERRRLLHERTAQALEALYPAWLEDHLTELAHHFERSGNVPKAVEYLGRSGVRAAQQMAHAEAIDCFTRALALLRRLPDGAARARQELDLQMALSWSLFVARGSRAPEYEAAVVRERELCELVGDNAKLLEVLLALAHLRVNRRDFALGRDLAEKVLAIAQQAKASATLAGAHNLLGIIQFATGHFPAAREQLERAVELFVASPSRNLHAYFARNAPNILVAVLVILGYPLTALSRAHELLAAARRSSDPYAVAIDLFSHGIHHLLLRDTRLMAERADEMRSIATEHEMAVYVIAATFFRGWAMAAAGHGEEGIAEMRRSIADPMIAEALTTAMMLVALAETCGKNGRAEEGLI